MHSRLRIASLVSLVAALVVLYAPAVALAEPYSGYVREEQVGVPNTPTEQQTGVLNTVTLINPLGAGTSLPVLLNDVLKFIVRIGAIIVIGMLVYVGYRFVEARGEPAKLTTARRALLNTVLGALILLGAQVIALGVCQTVNALSTGGSAISCSPLQ